MDVKKELATCNGAGNLQQFPEGQQLQKAVGCMRGWFGMDKAMDGSHLIKEHLLDRIYGEYQAYRADILGLSNAEIFGRSYEIDTTVNIYEILMEKVRGLPDDTLAALLPHKNILTELYGLWLEKDDSNYQELVAHVEEEIGRM